MGDYISNDPRESGINDSLQSPWGGPSSTTSTSSILSIQKEQTKEAKRLEQQRAHEYQQSQALRTQFDQLSASEQRAGWSGAPSVPRAKSLREIQEEERTAAARNKSSQPAAATSSMASIVAARPQGGGTPRGWGVRPPSFNSNSAQPETESNNHSWDSHDGSNSHTDVSKPAQPSQAVASPAALGGAWAGRQSTVAATHKVSQSAPNAAGDFPTLSSKPTTQGHQAKASSRNVRNHDVPSATQQREPDTARERLGKFKQWCREQMVILTGTDDITVLEFCMSMTSYEEVKDVICEFIGTSSNVVKFVKEFYKRKAGTL